MSDGDDFDGPRTEATIHRTRWPGWIWAIPLAVLGIVGWLIISHFAERGPQVTVSFSSAEGIQAGDTKVLYKGIEVGRVEDVELAKDFGHVVVTLALNSEIAPALRAGTRFWIAGANPSLTDLSSLKAVVSGPIIAIDPGQGPPERNFVGLEKPPQVLFGTPGMAVVLHCANRGGVQAGAKLTYRGEEVGIVEDVRFLGAGQGFDVVAFIRSPHEGLVTGDTRFWVADSVGLSLEGGGLSAHLPPASAVLTGAIAFDALGEAAGGPAAAAGSRFPLYDGKEAADAAPIGQQVRFLIRFEGAVGDLAPGAAVTLRGFRVGRVAAVELEYDAASGTLRTPVTIEIDAPRLHLPPPSGGDWTKAATEAMGRLVHQGLKARIENVNPVIGGKQVVLAMDGGTSQTPPGEGMVPEIPSAPSSDINALITRAQAILDTVGALPLARIGGEVEGAAHRIATLVSSPQVTRSLDHLDQTLATLERVSRQTGPQIGPLVASLRKTADAAQQTVASAGSVLGGGGAAPERDIPEALDELSRTARSIRALANYLDQHPEALIAGRTGP